MFLGKKRLKENFVKWRKIEYFRELSQRRSGFTLQISEPLKFQCRIKEWKCMPFWVYFNLPLLLDVKLWGSGTCLSSPHLLLLMWPSSVMSCSFSGTVTLQNWKWMCSVGEEMFMPVIYCSTFLIYRLFPHPFSLFYVFCQCDLWT